MSFLNDPLIAETTPLSWLKAMREMGSQTPSPEQQEARKQRLARLLEAERNAKRLKDASVLFAAGTDAPYPGDFQGEGLHREMELLVESGLTPLEAITAATKNAARIMNAEAEWGTVERGKLADIVPVDGKPDRNISDSRKISIVMKAGTVLDRNRLKPDPGYQPVGRLASPGPG